MCGGRGAWFTALQMSSSWLLVHLRWASGHREAVSAVPRYPSGRGSSCDKTQMRCPPSDTWASLALRASSLSDFFLMDWRFCRYDVILHLPTELDAGPCAKLFDYIEQGAHVGDGIGNQCAIVHIPFAGEAETTRG